MTRAANHKLTPSDEDCAGVTLGTYTYAYADDITFPSMRETVYLDISSRIFQAMAPLTPAEARQLAQHLLDVAAAADEHRARRESLEEIEEQLRDPDFDAALCRFVHPDVVYCAPGQVGETADQHPGKVVIALADEVPA